MPQTTVSPTKWSTFVLLLVSHSLFAQLDTEAMSDALGERGEVHLGLFNGDARDGFMRLGWYRDDGVLVVYDRTMMPSAEIYETLVATMNEENLSPQSVFIRFHQGTAVLEIDAELDASAVSGTRTVLRPGQAPEQSEIATPLPSGALLRAVTFLLPLAMDSDPGQEISYNWYGPLSGQVEGITLTSVDGGQVETPSGPVATTRWELRGGTPENDIYVSSEPSPRIVRIDVLGQPLRFLAVE